MNGHFQMFICVFVQERILLQSDYAALNIHISLLNETSRPAQSGDFRKAAVLGIPTTIQTSKPQMKPEVPEAGLLEDLQIQRGRVFFILEDTKMTTAELQCGLYSYDASREEITARNRC